jgi:pyridoxamine 5'-phosphate oxidase
VTRRSIDEQREEWLAAGLDLDDVGPDPLEQVRRWWRAAEEAGVDEPGAMTLATVDEQGHPDARMVLLRSIDAEGFRWYTDRRSAKGRQLAAVPHAALVLAWTPLGRQVRVVGAVRESTDAESDAYWATRPRGSQLAAVASHQSQVLASRVELDTALADAEARHAGRDGPRPSTWGGYVLRPARVELWQQRPFRAHDRLRYERDGETWRIVRLSP